MYCLDAKTGKELWRFRTGDEMINNIPFIIHRGVLYFGSLDNYLYAVDCNTGKELWRFKSGKYGIGGSMPIVHNNVLYFGTRDGDFFALTLRGRELWRFRAGGPIIGQQPRLYNGMIIFGCEDENVYFLDMAGKELWRFRTGGRTYGKFLLHEGKVYIGSWDCYFYAIDIDKRKEVWRCPTSTMVQAYIAPAHASFSAEIKKETHVEDAVSDDRYKAKKKDETVSLSDYHVTSEYSTTSEYKQKSDYDVNLVTFENIVEEELWISALKVSNPPILKRN